MADEGARKKMLGVAESYDRLAAHAEDRRKSAGA
jgi:hypothetical protein